MKSLNSSQMYVAASRIQIIIRCVAPSAPASKKSENSFRHQVLRVPPDLKSGKIKFISLNGGFQLYIERREKELGGAMVAMFVPLIKSLSALPARRRQTNLQLDAA